MLGLKFRLPVVLTAAFLVVFFLRVQQVGGLSDDFSNQDDGQDKVIRHDLSQRVEQLMPSPQAQLLSGILLGEKSNLPHSFTLALQNTSTIHIVVVSGQNLSLVAGFALSLVSLLGRKKTLILASLIVLGYSYLTGFQIPVIRAALMVELGFAAQILGKDREGIWILFVSGAAMLIYNPSWLLSISFQLSFMATFAVIAVAPEVIKTLGFIPEILKEDLGVSLAAQLLTWPIIAVNFHQFSVVGVFVNALVLWTVSFVMISGAVALLVSFLFFGLGQIIALLPGILLTYFVYVISFFNHLSFSNIKFPDVSPVCWVGYYLLLLGVFLHLRQLGSKG